MRSLVHCIIYFSIIFKSFSNNQRIVGDMNGDGIVNLIDTIKMVNHIQGTGFTTDLETLKWQADVNGDGLVNSFDVEGSLEFIFQRESIRALPLAGMLNTFPYDGEGDISLTREFVIHFNMPLAQGSVLTNEAFYALSGDSLQVTSARLSSDRMKATLFLNGFRWPSNSKVKVTFNGNGLTDFLGRGIDIDGDGIEGGSSNWIFSTLGVEASDPTTIVEGQVFDSDNSNGEKPLEGVLITVVGNEDAMSVLTDSNGSFRLTSAPIGRFFVMVDGRLVGAPSGETIKQGSWQNRAYYTFVGKAWRAVPGKTMKATLYGKFAEDGTYVDDQRDGKIFLPLVKKGALQVVDSTKETKVSFASGYLDGNDANLMSMLASTSITIPPGSLQSDDGFTGGSVGMAPVAPDRLPEPLPEGLAMPLVITIQTDGASNFDVPVPARFPNVDNLPPGAKSALWSFDHDTGVWGISGPMTVSADGKYLDTDPGVGIRQPGWHGSSPGAQIYGKAVTTGPSIKKPKKGACALSHSTMAITENEFTSLGRISEGIEESIFGQNEKDLAFAKDVLSAGDRFGKSKNSGGENWNKFRTHASKDAQIHLTIARKVANLLGSNDLWNTFSSTSTIIRDNALLASKNGSAQSKINQAHKVFAVELDRAKASISKQIGKWEDYSVALAAFIGQTNGISTQSVIQSDRSLISNEIKTTLKAFKSLPGGHNRLDAQLKRFAESWQKFLQATLNGNLHDYKGESFVFLKRIGSEQEENRIPPIAAQRIRVGTGGSYDAIVRPSSWYEAWMLEPTTLVIGSTTFISPRNGGNGHVAAIPLCHDDKPDSDFDYLSDRGERIVGTNKNQPDTDGDGIPDGFEILNGTDPSGGNPVFTGVLATIAPTRGFSDFVTTGNDLAILGNGPDGVDIFDIGSGIRPIKQSTFNTPGSVRKAALTEGYLVIADGSAGLTVLDLTSIESPSQVWNIPQESPANAVAVAGKIAFIGLENGKIKSYDLFSGQKIDEIHPGKTIEDLAIIGDSLIALENVQKQRSRVHSIPVFNGRFSDDDGPFLPRNSVDTPGHRQWGLKNGLGRRLFVGDDFAYVTDLMGFNRIDLSDPTTPVRAERTKTPSRGWRQTVSNGSGLAIVLEHRNSPKFAQADPSIYTVQKNGDFLRAGGYMENFETRFPTPGNAGAVSIYNGLAYVADGKKGLQVVNYRAYDINGIKPTLSVTLNDMNGSVEEAKLLTLRAFVGDDIQVKNVDFFVDGEKVFVDGGYPFAHTLEVPLRKDQATLRLRIIARDTGGNEAYWPGPGASNEHTLTIADDLVPPQVVTYFPRENSTVLPGETVVAVFNERMAPDSIHVRSIRLDRLNDNNTTTPIELASVVYDDATQSAYAKLPAILPPANYRLYVNELATDLPSNPLKTPAPVRNLFGPSEIHGQFWFDRNHNTVQDSGEEILKEWTAFLDYNNNGEFDIGEPNATSDPAGNYSFTNLYPGGYSVAEVLPHGWAQTFPKGQNLGTDEQFTNVGWIGEGDQAINQVFTVDTLGNGWTAGIVPEGNFSIGTTAFDGNGTAGQLFIARVAPTGLVDKVVSLGNPDINNTSLAPNLILKPDIDAGIWLTGSFSGNGLSIPGAALDANSTTAFATRFDQDLNASLTTVFPNSTILDLSTDPDGRVAIAGTFTGSTTMGTTTLTSNGGADAFIAKIASTGKIAWAKSLGGSQWESVQSISVDVNGSLWIAGDSNSSNFTADTTNLDLSGNAGGYLAQYNQSGSNLWAIDPIGQVSLLDDSSAAWFLDQNGSTMLIKKVSANGTITSITSITGSIVTDLISTTDGGVNVSLSTTSGTISVNGVNVSANTANSGLLLKLKSNGDLAWSIPLSTNGSDSITQLARGSLPDTWAMGTVGTTNQSLTYGAKTIDLNSSTGVLLKIDPIGEVTSIWAIPVVGNLYIDVNDNVWVTGNNSGDPGLTRTITIGALPLQTESAKGNYIGRIGSAGSESHTIQLGSGEIQQNKNFGNSLPLIESRKAICVGGPNEDASRSVVTDPAGNAYYAGDFTGHTEFGGRKLKSDGQNDAMFVKFLPNGKIDWAKNFGGDGDDLGHAIFADDNGSLFASGTFQGTAKFGDFTLVSAGMRDIFVLRLDDNGTPTHAFRAGGPRDDDAFSLVADSNNSVYVGGAIEQTADFGPYQLTSQGNRDAYLLRLDYNLTAQWVGSLMSQDQAEIRSLTLDQNNLPVAAGDFAGTLQLRGTAIKDGDSNSTYENNATAPSIAFNIISPSDNGIVDNNATLQITSAYLSPPVGYQSPTWAYRIDSGFPGYGSPHGGTQVNGNTTVANFMNGQAYGTKQIHVALLDANGSLYNPPVTKSISVNYQSSGGGYQTPVGDYIAVGFPSSGSLILPSNDTLQVYTNYASPSGGYQTPTWAYRIDSGFPGYGSPHGGTQITGNYAQNFLDGQSSGGRQIHVALLDSNGSLHNPPVTNTISVNYQTGSQSGSSEPTEIFTFTNAGASGRFGPTQQQINAEYVATNLANKVSISTQGIQEWIVPQTGKYKIEAFGARGGGGEENAFGKGASISGSFSLTKGSKILIVSGQMGETKSEGGGGGGASFVVKSNNLEKLIIAGGGGGSGDDNPIAHPGVHGSSTQQGNPGGIGSNNKNPSNGGIALGTGGGLAGTSFDGGPGAGFGENGSGSRGGFKFLEGNNGSLGGTASGSSNGGGGFGGGGGANYSGGGGGGYSGGGGGGSGGGVGDSSGGGGGSYNSGTEQINLAGANNGHGKVVISLLGNPKLESAGQKDFFVARFDGNGTVTDSAHGSGTGIEGVNGIAIGKQNEFYLTGIYGSQLSIGDQNATGGNNFVNTYLLQLNSDLSTSWIKTIGGGGFNRGESVAVSTKGTAFFTGSYTGTSTFDEGSLTSAGGSDVYLAEFDQRGNLYRLISHGGTMADAGTAVALDNNGGIIMTGTYQGEADFFGGEHTCHEHGGTDVFIARYDYTLQAPETKYVVSVVQDENGTEKFLINNEEDPELELIPGLEYEFELDGNTTTDHPFTFTEEGTGGQDEAWDSKDDVNNSGATTGKIIVKVDEKTPDTLKYKSGKKDDVGGVIKIKQNKTPSYRLTMAEFDDGLNNVNGANIVVTKNGQPVNLDEPFEKGTRLRVSLKPKEGFIFEGWQGDLPTDANGTLPSDETFVISMDQDRTLKAYFSKYAPDPRDFLDQFEFIMQAKQADEFGQPIPGGDGPNYMLVFTLDQGGIAADGTSGQMGVQPIGNQPDLDGDGKSDVITGRFIFDQINENQGVFQAVNPMVIYSRGNGTPEPIWGGGMELSFLFEKPNGKKEQGAYVMLKNDGTQEQGDFGSDQIRKDFTLDN